VVAGTGLGAAVGVCASLPIHFLRISPQHPELIVPRLCLLSSQRYTVEPTLSGRYLLGGVSKQPVAGIHAEGHLSALTDAARLKEMRVKMVQNIRTRDFVFRL
jgi:hypothetical protein